MLEHHTQHLVFTWTFQVIRVISSFIVRYFNTQDTQLHPQEFSVPSTTRRANFDASRKCTR